MVQEGLGVDVVYPIQTIGILAESIVAPWDMAEGATHKCVESDITVLSSEVRFPHGIIELSCPIHKKHVKVLVNSGSTSNYISDKIV